MRYKRRIAKKIYRAGRRGVSVGAQLSTGGMVGRTYGYQGPASGLGPVGVGGRAGGRGVPEVYWPAVDNRLTQGGRGGRALTGGFVGFLVGAGVAAFVTGGIVPVILGYFVGALIGAISGKRL